MASKTKAQLEQEIKNSREQIECLKLELEKANRGETKTMPHKNFMRCMKPIQKPVSLRNRLGSLRKSL